MKRKHAEAPTVLTSIAAARSSPNPVILEGFRLADDGVGFTDDQAVWFE